VAGALFGLGWGFFAMIVAMIVAAGVNYGMANRLLRGRVMTVLARHPKLLAIQRAVQREGWRLQFMLRLTPVSAVSVNYILGAAGVRFLPYTLATLGLIPGLFVEVYFGHVAKHVATSSAGVSPDSPMHLTLTITGFLVCAAVMIAVGRMAKRALADAAARE
jgi:uncharacterized membrane protein YdjX (TVP38/TMEM64 family)